MALNDVCCMMLDIKIYNSHYFMSSTLASAGPVTISGVFPPYVRIIIKFYGQWQATSILQCFSSYSCILLYSIRSVQI